MMKYFILFILFTLSPAYAVSPIVADLSNYRINMDSSFNGTRIFLFGARNDSGDVVVVVRGPNKNFIIRKKEEMGGIWINRDRMKFFNVPDFYAIATSKPLAEIEQTELFNRLGIGHDSLLLNAGNAKTRDNMKQFADAFERYQQERRLYMSEPEQVNFMGETLFKTIIEFPDDTPPGNYTAEIYLINNGELAGMQSTPIRVVKSGIDAFLYEYAHHSPVFYGISAIVLALCAGWFGGRLFEKI
jgi:uncharacterized protein (TIGR02186 family)